ncbi:ABC1-domain-containing protein [Basidiobolus meristosporus CBS 931.73]|uniref:ABC1-domain-containing protein n=1 Tax=Basidiobolus meristosporus CBS 931.73 TaxID=1314790 RepID=A0A1Y1YWD6_9FUNG|nr:ABC1-domain-containing protein [Basidiobolus meristosporus CBS 931.73]|eukprot:ORY02154.1 ABC1-domain-containing protein [Basidiobolus meristosporus CBS 931.73]
MNRARLSPVTNLRVLSSLQPSSYLKLSHEVNCELPLKPVVLRQDLPTTPAEDHKKSSLIVRLVHKFRNFLSIYIFEPIRISCRFMYLVILFVPLIVTAPVMLVGKRNPERENETSGSLWWYDFLVVQMERAGPTFIKLSQWAASRTDLFSSEFCRVLSKLHNRVDPHPWSHTKRSIEAAFGGRSMDEIFEEFDKQPIGIGAIAQVYKARIKPGIHGMAVDSANDGTSNHTESVEVAIKVLHPRVDKLVARDLKIMMFFGKILNWIPMLHWLSFPQEIQVFGDMMEKQLDLRLEAENMLRFRKNFAQNPNIDFSTPWKAFVSKNVLVQNYMYGVPLKYFMNSKVNSVYDEKIANIGLNGFLHMLIYDNFIHADLHPGNIMVKFIQPHAKPIGDRLIERFKPTKALEESDDIVRNLLAVKDSPEEWKAQLLSLFEQGYQPQVIFLDTGLVTTLDDDNRRDFLDLFKAIAVFDGYRAGELMVERCRTPELVVNPEGFAHKVENLVNRVKSVTFQLSKVDVSHILASVLSMVREHHVKLEGDFINVIISILILEGIGRRLDPELDILKEAVPILRSLGTQGNGRAVLEGMKELPAGGGWWLKTWFLLEARKFWMDALSFKTEQELFGEFAYFDLV